MKILNLNQFNERLNIDKIDIKKLRKTFPEYGKTPKDSLKTGMIVELVYEDKNNLNSLYGVIDVTYNGTYFINMGNLINPKLYQFDDNLLGTDHWLTRAEQFTKKCYIKKVYSCDDNNTKIMASKGELVPNKQHINMTLIWESPFDIEDCEINTNNK